MSFLSPTVKIVPEDMMIVEDDSLDEDEVNVCTACSSTYQFLS